MILFIVMCCFSKRAHFIPCAKRLDARGVIDILYRFIFAYHVFPNRSYMPRYTLAKLFRDFTERPGIKLNMSSSNHPQNDGQSERSIQTLNGLLRTYTNSDHALWDVFLPQIEYVYNSTPSQSSGLTPFEVDCGYIPMEPTISTDAEIRPRSFEAVALTRHLKTITTIAKDALATAQRRQETIHNKGRKEIGFEIGKFALLHRDAYHNTGRYWNVQPFFVGPFSVVKKINEKAYELDLP